MKNSQIKYFAKMLGETFEKDDFYVKFFPKEEQRKKFIYELFLMRMKIFGKGCEIFTFEDKGIAFFKRSDFVLKKSAFILHPRIFKMYFWDRELCKKLLNLIAQADKIEKECCPAPHYTISPIGVRNDCKGMGIGKRLMEQGLSLADKKGIHCFLETQNKANIAFYEKFGFELCKTQYVKDIDLHNYFMVRKPQKND